MRRSADRCAFPTSRRQCPGRKSMYLPSKILRCWISYVKHSFKALQILRVRRLANHLAANCVSSSWPPKWSSGASVVSLSATPCRRGGGRTAIFYCRSMNGAPNSAAHAPAKCIRLSLEWAIVALLTVLANIATLCPPSSTLAADNRHETRRRTHRCLHL